MGSEIDMFTAAGQQQSGALSDLMDGLARCRDAAEALKNNLDVIFSEKAGKIGGDADAEQPFNPDEVNEFVLQTLFHLNEAAVRIQEGREQMLSGRAALKTLNEIGLIDQ